MKSMTGYGHLTNARSSTSAPAEPASSAPVGPATSAGRAGKDRSQIVAPSTPIVELDIAIRAVNGRYLELRFHLPREYAGFENEMKSLVSQTFSRGTVDLYINRVRTSGASRINVAVNTSLAKRWIQGFEELGRELKLEAKPTLDQVIRVPDVLQIEQKPEVSEEEQNELMALLTRVVAAADSERKREGAALAVELHQLCDKLDSLSASVELYKAEANAELEKRFRDRLAKLGFEGKVDDQRLAQEIVMQIDRSDVSEEITRLREHLVAYRGLLSSIEPQGKKLDFYAQELLREVNTIGSKSHVVKLTGLVVEAKTLVEKIREQVQNVE